MKTQTQHTPTPISIMAQPQGGDDRVRLVDADGAFIGALMDYADAEKIVRAVNAHDELVAALKQMKIAMKNFLTLEGGIEKSAMEAADRALAAAEGR